MTPSPKSLKGLEQCQDYCTGEKFVRKRAVSQIEQKQWRTKSDLDRFYVNLVLQDQTALASTPVFNTTTLLCSLFGYVETD